MSCFTADASGMSGEGLNFSNDRGVLFSAIIEVTLDAFHGATFVPEVPRIALFAASAPASLCITSLPSPPDPMFARKSSLRPNTPVELALPIGLNRNVFLSGAPFSGSKASSTEDVLDTDAYAEVVAVEKTECDDADVVFCVFQACNCWPRLFFGRPDIAYLTR